MENRYSIPVHACMTRIPFTIEKGMTVRVAVELMRRHGIRHLPVEESGRLLGVLTDWDILSAQSVEAALEQKVEERMTPDPYRVPGSTPVREVLGYMSVAGLGSALIVDESGAIQGIFTERDAVRMMAQLS